MPRVHQSEEVRILRFFEEEPLEKATLLFHIISEKMRTRLPPGRAGPKKNNPPVRETLRDAKSKEEVHGI
jgi:hypothetical protein